MVSDGVAPQLKINFNTIQSYRIHGNRSKLDIYPLLSQQNCKIKFGSMNFQFFLVWRLYAHKLHAPCSQAPRSRSHASVVAQVSPTKPAVKSRAQKRKSIVGAPGDEEPVEGSQKKKRKVSTQALTIKRAVNMTNVDINKLSLEEMKAMNKLFLDFFTPCTSGQKNH